MNRSRILIIDDDEGIAKLVQIMLENSRLYQTRVETRSQRALAAAREFHPDVVLLDVDMPGLDGGDVARQLRNEPALAETPIIFFTSLVSQQEARQQMISRGGEYFLAKPVEPAVLIRSLETILGGNAHAA